jgi:tripartite-type tricarboxylate transporter receptor subunit TctC
MMSRVRAALVAAVAVFSNPTHAQEWAPTKPVRMVVAFAVGGSTDIFARLMQGKLSELLGQQVVVENKPGAGGNIGTDMVAKAPPDGHTVLLGTASSFAFNPGVYATMPYDPVKDFAPVAQIGVTKYAFVVHKDVPVKDVAGLVALVKANPGKYTYGSPGIGAVPHICTEEFKRMAGGLDITHVPYRGAGPLMNDLIGGQITMAFDAVPTSVPQIQAGTIKAIANGSLARARGLPDIPTVDEQGVRGFDCYVWFGLFAPAKTPANIVAKWNAVLNAALADPPIANRLRDLGLEMLPHTTPESWGAYVKAEIDKWVPIAKASGAKLD